MKFLHSFAAFLKDHVNLNESRLKRANDAFETLTSFLENAAPTAELFIDTFRQGSLRQGTIVKPRKDETEFDVDLLLRMRVVSRWVPADYLNAVHNAFKESDRYTGLVDRRGKHRCVTIDYEGDFHVDVVPSIDIDGRCWIMNRDANEFEIADGDGYARWFARQNSAANGQLVKVVRLAKYLRDEHDWPVKSILLTTLLGQQVRAGDSSALYPDVPTSLRLLMQRLAEWLRLQQTTPGVTNPALAEETFTRHWNREIFESFRDEVERVAQLIVVAHDSADEEASAVAWQEAFGDEFPILDEDLKDGESLRTAQLALGDASHARPLSDIAQAERRTSTVRVDAWVYDWSGKRRFRGINSGTKVSAERAIRFKAWTNAREPFDIWWQIVNTGKHAAARNGLRGGFQRGRTLKNKPAQSLYNWEVTAYTGSHWVECFVVKDGVCVGRSGRFVVNIKSNDV